MNLIAFCLQEVILGIIFLVNIKKVLGDDRPAVVTQTLRINVMVLALDIVTVAVEYAHLHDYQVVTKCVVYSIKLKCEFYILSLLEDALKPTRNTVSSNEVLAQAMRNAKAAEARMSENTLSDVVRKSISL
ncbi:hypothetical protein HDU79_004597 [Rhizoclosmatium sp. JEL0117]|nr:hypothetical protein HDU79_004597 [Rhizoclosmatium sp. JEL0117]